MAQVFMDHPVSGSFGTSLAPTSLLRAMLYQLAPVCSRQLELIQPHERTIPDHVFERTFPVIVPTWCQI
jgi:hypothetical protein